MTAPLSPRTSARPSTPPWIRPWQRLLQVGMRILGAFNSRYAAKVMDRLWFSAPRTTPRASDQAVLASGERLSFQVHGRQVVAWAWGEGSPTIVLLHGWGGHAGQLRSFVLPLREAGFRVVAFDAPSHGSSEASWHGGRRVTFFEFADALRMITSGETSVAGIIAHSGGCTAVSLALRAGWTPPASMVFVAPFVRPAAAIDGFARAIGANGRVVAEFRARVERWLGQPWSYLDIAPPGDAHRLHRLLVIHDEDDKEVPLAHARVLAASWPSAHLVVTQGLGHRRVLRDPGVVDRVLGFFMDEVTVDAPVYLPRDSRASLDEAFEACVDRH